MATDALERKRERLEALLQEMGGVVVAYSGGVDSTFLAVTAADVLGPRALAATAVSPAVPPPDLQDAVEVARRFGLRHRLVYTREMEDPNYTANSPRRCYFCKSELYSRLLRLAREEGLPWVATGTNLDDLSDYRPGLEAAREMGVRSPLVEAGLTKADVRALSRRRGLPTWDKPAQPCLASRIPYGTPVTLEALRRIARAEAFLRDLGFRQVRVRHHGEVARVEVPLEDLPRLASPSLAPRVVEHLRGLGYTYVTLDLAGFRSGSLNEALSRASNPRKE